MDVQEKRGSVTIIGTVVALVIAVASLGFYQYTKRENVSGESVVLPPATPNTAIETYLYKDGNYSVVGSYISPGGAEEARISLTLKEDVVTDVVLTPSSPRPISLKMQQTVASNVRALVVGKKLDEVKLDKVSGSSLTPKGFNDAIEKIKILARV